MIDEFFCDCLESEVVCLNPTYMELLRRQGILLDDVESARCSLQVIVCLKSGKEKVFEFSDPKRAYGFASFVSDGA